MNDAPHQPIRVMLLISTLEYGGAQRQVIELVNFLDPRRFDVHVCSLKDFVPLGGQLRDRQHRLHIVQKLHKFDFTVVWRLARLLKRLRIDILQSYLFDADIASRIAGRLARTPLVINSERNTDYHFKKRHLVAYRLTRRWVHYVIANSSAGAAFNSRSLGMPADMYRVVYNGVDTQRFQPDPRTGAQLRAELGIAADEHVVGMFASFKPQKNHALFFEAAAKVIHELPNTRLLLMGDMLHGGMMDSDQYKADIDQLVDKLGIRPRCIFLGNRADVERYYCACDLTVLSSRFEGTSNVLLESMSCGVPVVATNVSDNSRIVPQRCGQVVPLGDVNALATSIVDILHHETERRNMGIAGRVWVQEEFSRQRLAEKMTDVYLEFLQHRREASR